MASPAVRLPADGQVSDLVALIRNATDIIESQYLESSLPTIPSLNSLAPHPLDSAISSVLTSAVQLLEGACAQFTGEENDATSKLVEVLADPDWGNSQAIERSPWNKLTGYKSSLFQYWESPEGAKAGASFGIGMGGYINAVQSAAMLVDFPWRMYPPGTTVNDVGGGIGLMAMELIKAFTNLQLKLQDLPDRILQAETEVWPRLLPSAIAEKRIEFESMDFFVDLPIAGCDVYYLKNIIHDWPDEDCVRILRNIRAVLKPGARVLI
ncbi:hypothetical protein C0992_004512, partial [Termitomyces sp. T32_za158]